MRQGQRIIPESLTVTPAYTSPAYLSSAIPCSADQVLIHLHVLQPRQGVISSDHRPGANVVEFFVGWMESFCNRIAHLARW